MPLAQGVLEIVDDPLFDTLYTRAPRGSAMRDREQLFVAPRGAMMQTNEGVRVKEFADTNMWQSGMLPAPNRFAVKALRCAFIGRKILPVSSRFYADTYVQLVIGQKTYWNGPAWKCADPVTMVLNADTLLAMGRHKRVDLVRALRRTFDPVPIIDQQEPFYVEVTFGQSWREFADDAPDRLVVVLEGKLARAIQ